MATASTTLREMVKKKRRVIWHCRVPELRKQRGVTLRQMEEETGVSAGCISQLKDGTDVSLSTATALSKFFNVPIDQLWLDRSSS